MPMDVMVDYITDCVGKDASLSMRERNEISETDNDYANLRLFYQSAQLFIEEPEQNLFPESQKLVIMSNFRSLKKAMGNGPGQSLALITTHSPYIMSVVNVLLATAIVTEKGLKQEVIEEDCILSSSSISGYFIDEKDFFQNILDVEVSMLNGNDLDGVSDWVDNSISKLNETLFATI